jgi:hypothetical protein
MKHKYYDVIMAWAEGKPIQYQNCVLVNWCDLEEGKSPNFEAPHVNWRIKPEPETRKYRVALFKDPEKGYCYTSTEDDYQNEDYENSRRFVKWLTDWTKYETQ